MYAYVTCKYVCAHTKMKQLALNAVALQVELTGVYMCAK